MTHAPTQSLRRLRNYLVTRRMTKGDAELFYWRHRQELEGTLRHDHYEELYTTHFGLSRADYTNTRILDVGCGPRGSLEWADNALERVGLDPLVGQYRALGIDEHRMRYVESGAEQMPFADSYFDTVTALNSLDHVDDVTAVIREMTRVTKPGGLGLVIAEVNHRPRPTDPQQLSWNLFDEFQAWRVVSERRLAMNRDHEIRASLRANASWCSGPGLLIGRLERR